MSTVGRRLWCSVILIFLHWYAAALHQNRCDRPQLLLWELLKQKTENIHNSRTSFRLQRSLDITVYCSSKTCPVIWSFETYFFFITNNNTRYSNLATVFTFETVRHKGADILETNVGKQCTDLVKFSTWNEPSTLKLHSGERIQPTSTCNLENVERRKLILDVVIITIDKGHPPPTVDLLTLPCVYLNFLVNRTHHYG